MYLERRRGGYGRQGGRFGTGIDGTLKTGQPGNDPRTHTHLYTLYCGFGRQSNTHAFKYSFPLSDSHTHTSHTGNMQLSPVHIIIDMHVLTGTGLQLRFS